MIIFLPIFDTIPDVEILNVERKQANVEDKLIVDVL